MKTYHQKEWLIQQITKAFDGVMLEEGVSLHETVVIDNYGSSSERAIARQPDEKKDWQKLVQHPDLAEVTGIGGLSFFDAKGMRFHLPAYMITTIHQVYTEFNIVFSLCHLSNYSKERFAILNTAQRRAIRAFLKYLLNNGGKAYEFDHPKIHKALKEYWHSGNDFI